MYVGCCVCSLGVHTHVVCCCLFVVVLACNPLMCVCVALRWMCVVTIVWCSDVCVVLMESMVCKRFEVAFYCSLTCIGITRQRCLCVVAIAGCVAHCVSNVLAGNI